MRGKNKQFKPKAKSKVADQIRKGILTFFDTVGPVWNFFFVKTRDPALSNRNS